jgi:NitT/TauT family transport system ATP-binding protein
VVTLGTATRTRTYEEPRVEAAVPAPPIIDVEKLGKEFTTDRGVTIRALESISFKAREGEFISVVGPSGCGKSTLLRILSGITGFEQGSAALFGASPKNSRFPIGMVFQTPSLLPWRRVIDNVLLPVELIGKRPRDYREEAKRLLHLTGLAEFADRYPFELSGGMQQRVGICRALVLDPPLLLMDEPFGALDAMTRESMMLELQDIWMRQRKTVIFVTHSLSEAVFLSDRVLVLSCRPGRVVEDVAIGLERPRRLEIQDQPEFGRHSAVVRHALQRGLILPDEEFPRGSEEAKT